MDKFCCIDTNDIFENSNFQHTINNSTFGRDESNSFPSGPSGELKFLPESNISVTPSKNPKIKINSLSRIPISTKNVIRKKSGNPFENYKLIKKLGHGTFGQVYKIIHIQTGNIRAMKIIPKNNLKPGFTDKDIIQEITIMENLDHPHIIKLFEFYIDENNYYLINEFCTEGDLSEKMHKLKSIPETIVKILMAQIFTAVLYLNNRGIIHGDLKLENILVDSYLDDGYKDVKNEKPNFISSLIQDAKNIRIYLARSKIKRASTNFFNNFKAKLNEEMKEEKDDKDKEIEGSSSKILLKIKNRNKNKHKKRNTLVIDLNPKEQFKSEQNTQKYAEENDVIYEECDEKREDDILMLEDKKNNSEDSNDENSLHFSSKIYEQNDDSSQIFTPKKKEEEDSFSIEEQSNQKMINLHKSTPFSKFKEEKKDNTEYKICKTNAKNKFERKATYNYNKLNIKNFELKLIDFGCSKIFTQYRRTFEDTIGTLVYCSPEVLKNNYNQKCDIWSCGVIMYILLSGKYPFYGSSEEEITKKILLGNYDFNDKHFENVSEAAKDLIKKCLIHDKNKRISVRDALKHEFFAGELDINNIFEDHIETRNVLTNIKNNSRKISKFYQTVLAYLSYNFADKEELKKLRKIFYKIDLNLDGKLSKEEMYLAYQEAGIDINKEELEKIMKSIDFDGNGSIEYEEFIRVTLSKEQLFTDINLRTAFDMFDLNKNGTISLNEILEVIGADKDIDKKVIEQLKQEILKDGDEEMDFKHFKDIMMGLI